MSDGVLFRTGERRASRWTAGSSDMCGACFNVEHMTKMVQIRNVPDEVHRTLKLRAAAAGMSLSDYLLAEIAALTEIPTLEELAERLRSLPPTVDPEETSADVVRRERDAA